MRRLRNRTPPSRPDADAEIEQWLTRRARGLDPDPLFRRRLRGHLLNGFVASGAQRRHELPRMGRLGRASLYASVLLAASVSSVMALADQALPGDALYPLKRQIEALRFQVLPAHLHDDLSMAVLTERLDEMRRLADAEEWAAVTDVANELRGLDPSAPVHANPAQLVVLDGILEQLPPITRASMDEVIHDAVVEDPTSAPREAADDDDDSAEEGAIATPAPRPTPSPTASPTASPTPSPSPTASPSPTPTSSPSPTPSPGPTRTPTEDDDDDDD